MKANTPEYRKAYYEKNRKRILRLNREYYQKNRKDLLEGAKIYAKSYYEINKESINKKQKAYREKTAIQRRKYYREWYAKNGRKRKPGYTDIIIIWQKKNPDKVRATKIVANAIRTGVLKKPKKCSLCPRKNTRIHGHHEDYNKPLEVDWVCASCHKRIALEGKAGVVNGKIK